jgi:hypothetical protein
VVAVGVTRLPRSGPDSRLRLEAEGVPLPGRSSVYRCLVRHGLIEPEARRRKKADYKRWERSRSMELWQMGIVGGVRLVNGWKAGIVSGIDDHFPVRDLGTCRRAGHGATGVRCVSQSDALLRCSPGGVDRHSTTRCSPAGSGLALVRCCSTGSAARTGSNTF